MKTTSLWSRYRPGLKVDSVPQPVLDLVSRCRSIFMQTSHNFFGRSEVSIWVCECLCTYLPVGEEVPSSSEEVYIPNPTLNSKVSLWHGDITRLEVDAIVCSTGGILTGSLQSNTVFAAVHHAAGSVLMSECQMLRRCEHGNAKVAFGYNLPAKCKFGYNIIVVGEK